MKINQLDPPQNIDRLIDGMCLDRSGFRVYSANERAECRVIIMVVIHPTAKIHSCIAVEDQVRQHQAATQISVPAEAAARADCRLV